uniref:Nitric oxide synthaseinteracting protein putative n=1 Tax=Albugo laibachii Nc14 TaxID=890382 RepID=F0WHE0_9STRA|nr:nitric oxide synthaseinteracting protein putative [Albugo laibachii Nc14]|eukprot:CCA20659.1 nitric oxide synthaseinteracting protein putative [Albugo laibachii Nc14]
MNIVIRQTTACLELESLSFYWYLFCRARSTSFMTRHSKNATATTHFTYFEKQRAGHGTLKRRFGKDSQLNFGACSLCLSSTTDKDSLLSPSGFLYCKECIYSNLLAQKQAIQQQKLEYERFCETEEQNAEKSRLEKEKKVVENMITSTPSHVESSSGGKEKAIRKLKEKVDQTLEEDRREAMKKTSYWIPDCTPDSKVTISKPDTATRDPMNPKEVLKLKHLMPAKLEWTSNPSSSSDKHVVCAVTKKAITHQQAVLLRSSGIVILETCLKDTVLPSMTCPITGIKLYKKDIIYLQCGGTGFSAHSTVEAKKYRSTIT